VYGRQTRLGYAFAVLQKASKTDYDKLVEGTSSRIATSVLSRKTRRLITSFAEGSIKATSTPARTTSTSASKTLA
jgi:hypothetical protein